MDKAPLKVLLHPSDEIESAHWGILWRAHFLSMDNRFDISVVNGSVMDALLYINCDVAVFQYSDWAKFNFSQIAALKKVGRFRTIFFTDQEIECDETLKFMKSCDVVCVTTKLLEDYFKRALGQREIVLMEDKIPRFWADHFYSRDLLLRNYRKHKSNPRIVTGETSSCLYWEMERLSRCEANIMVVDSQDDRNYLKAQALGLPVVFADEQDQVHSILENEESYLKRSDECRTLLDGNWLEDDDAFENLLFGRVKESL